VSLQCQKIEIKKLPFYASDITNFTSAVCAVVLEMSGIGGGEPLFESWAATYSGDLYDTFTTVSTYSSFWQQTDDYNVNTFVYSNSANILQSNSVVNNTSGNWNSVYNSYNTASSSFLTNSSGNSRYVKLSGDVMTGGLSSPSLSTNNLYVAGSTINFFDGTGSVIETLKSNDVGNFKSNYTLTNSHSGKWEETYSNFSVQSGNNTSVYNTVQTNSGNWNYQGTDLKSLTSNWENTYTNFSLQSSNNLSVYSNVNSKSANWDSTYSTVNTNSSTNWNYQGTDLKSLSSNWQNTYTGFSSQSANNLSVYNNVQTNSGNWNYQGTDLKALTGNWQNTYIGFSSQSGNNASVYSTVNSNSATNWNYQGSDLKALTGNWQNTYSNFSVQSANNISVYNTFNSNSGNYNSVYNTVQSNSATNWNYQGNDIKSLTANWQASYTALTSSSANWNDTRNTVQTNSATLWNYQGTDLKSLSSNWQNTYIGFSSQSANNLSVYSNVNTNSGNWNYQGTDIKSLTSNWENTYSNFSLQSANNLSVYNSVNTNSANWDSVYTDVSNTSGSWNDTTTSVQTNSSFWEYYDYSYKGSYRYSTSDAPFYDVKNVVINDQQVYDNLSNPLNTPDGNLYLCIKTLPNPYGYPAPVDENGTPQTEYWKLLEVDSVLARTANSVYNTVQTNSATWGSGSSPQTLSFNNINAELTISDGNTVSLSSLSGGGNGSVGVNYLSALYDVSIPSPVNGQVLTYNSITNKWNAGTPLSASGATGYYGSFYDTTAQTLTSTTQAKRIDIAQTYEQNGVSIDNNRIVFNYNGVYELIYSIQYKNTSNAQQDIYIWLKQNGNDIPNSSSVFTIPAHKNASIPAQIIAVSPFMSTLTAGDFIELYWHCNNTAVTIETFTTHTNPTIPDTPGVIVTVKQVTNVQIVPTVGAYLPLSGGTLTGAVSTTNVLYTTGGNSDQWNSTYSTVQSNSSTNWNYQGTDIKALTANWENTYTTFSTQSANNLSVYSIVQTNSSTNWNYQGTDIKSLTSNWQNTYVSFSSQSANNLSVYSTVNSYSATIWNPAGNYLPLSGGLITGNLNIFGNLSCNGTQTFNNTIFSTTSAVSVVHVGDGPALWVGNNGTGDIASFYDIDANVEVLHVGGNNGTFPNVGVKTSTPNVDFTVNGEISASSVIYDSSGNSNQWNNVYSTVQTNSGSWGGGGGSFVVEDANTIIGLSMFL